MANALKEKLAQRLEQPPTEKSVINETSSVAKTDSMIVAEPDRNGGIIQFSRRQEVNPGTVLVPDFAITLNDARERIRMLQEFVREMMKEGIDYGIVPGCNKPSLLKPGAEKLCDIFGFSKHLEVINRLEDWDKGIFHYEVKAVLLCKRTGEIEAEGLGSCNTKEKKYRSQDAYTIINTILKMAKKRALVDAVLSATRSSGIFTQDMEDFISEPTASSNRRTTINHPASGLVTKEQLTEIFAFVVQNSIPVVKIKALLQKRYGIRESKQLTLEQAEDLKLHLKTVSL